MAARVPTRWGFGEMVTLADVRKQYPQYQDMTDAQLADGLHAKFYSDMPRDEFNAKLGIYAKLPSGKQPQKGDKTLAPQFADLPVPGSPNFMPGGKPETSPNVEWAPGQGPKGSGILQNAAAGANDMLAGMIGAPADAGRNLINWGIAGVNAATGQPDLTKNMIRNAVGDKQSILNLFDMVGINRPEEVKAVTPAERIARATGEGAAAMLVPAMGLKTAAATGLAAPSAAEALAPVLGRANSMPALAMDTAVGAAAGTGAQVGKEVAPDYLDPLAAMAGAFAGGGLAAGAAEVPRAVAAGGRAIGDYLAPLTVKGQERIAGQTLRDSATSPGSVLDQIDQATQLVPGSQPTTGQLTGDMGLLALERRAATQDPAAFMQRRADQNTARLSALEGVGGQGAPEQVAASVRSYLADLEASANAAIDSASAAARGRTEALGQGMAPDQAGETMRGALETARAQAKAQERALWQAVDPNGTLALAATNTKQTAGQVLADMPAMAKPMEAEEGAIFQAVSTLPDNAPLSEITALQSRLKTAMRAERIANGESQAYRRLSQLNAAVQSDLEGAIATKVAQEHQAVAAGQMSMEQTAEHRIRQWQADYRQRQAGLADAAGAGGNGAMGTVALSGPRGAAGQSGGRLGDSAGNSGLSPNARGGIGSQGAADALGLGRVDQAALDRLSTARAATKARVETFDNKTLAPIRARPSTVSPYEMPAGSVPAKILFSGPASFDAIRAFQIATKGEGMPALAAYAIDRLRRVALREDGTLDPVRLASWRRGHADALRAFPQLDAAIADAATASRTMGEVAAAQRRALDDAQLGIVGKVMGLQDPQDVAKTVGSIFGRADARQAMARLRGAIGSNAEGKAGLRKAVADYVTSRFVGNTEAATTGESLIKSDQFQTFVRDHRTTLKIAGFSDAEIATMERVAADLRQANRSITAVRLPGQSNTAQDLNTLAPKLLGVPLTLLKALAAGAAGGGGAGAAVGPLGSGFGAAMGAITAVVFDAMRQNGLRSIDDLVRDALLDPAKAKALLEAVGPRQLRAKVAQFAGRLVRSGAVGASNGGSDARR
jgi:hypothetical protein